MCVAFLTHIDCLIYIDLLRVSMAIKVIERNRSHIMKESSHIAGMGKHICICISLTYLCNVPYGQYKFQSLHGICIYCIINDSMLLLYKMI